MTKFQNTDYLKDRQYAGADKLAARIRLHERFSTGTEQVQRWQFDRILPVVPDQAAVLEVGSGRGDLWQLNADRIPAGWQITLTDLSAGMLADHQRHLGDLASRFHYEVADVQNLPFADARFEVVIANYMLYHLPDLARGLTEIRRVLKPGGVLFAMTNGENHMIELDRLIGSFAVGEAESFGLMNVRHSFSLQNGEQWLREQFASVQREAFPTALRVTELPPLLDYIASALDDPDTRLRSDQGRGLVAALQQQIAHDGAIHITKETGMFTARGKVE